MGIRIAPKRQRARRLKLSTILHDTFRVLTFRRPSAAIATDWPSYLAFGLAMTWLAGIGRYWDSPSAATWQFLGLGSVAYVLLLSLVLWGLVAPMRPHNWSYRNVLLFVTMTSAPALLYAIPVERHFTLPVAQDMNLAFLAIVASWRVALLAWFLLAVARLRWYEAAVATQLPLALIVVALSLLDLQQATFSMMAGIRSEASAAHDTANELVYWMSAGSLLASPFLVSSWLILVLKRPAERGHTPPGATP